MNFLTEKQLKNLTTERLNALRKSVIKENAKAQYELSSRLERGSIVDVISVEARELQEYYDLIKEIMETREHIEDKPKAKGKKFSRDTIRGREYE